MSDYERLQCKILGLQGSWDNYVTPTGPSIKDNHEDTNGWGESTDPVDWAQVEYEENRRNQAEAQPHRFVNEDVEIIDVYDEVSVFSFESALDETFNEIYRRINWVELYGEFRTLYPIDDLTYMLPSCSGEKVKKYHYLMRMIRHEEMKEGRIKEEIIEAERRVEELKWLSKKLHLVTAVEELKVLRKKLRLVTAKKKIWINYIETVDEEHFE